MTPDAKATLRRTIGKLRGELLQGFRDAADTTYLLAVRIKQAGLSEAADKRRERLEAWIDEQIRAVPEADQKKAKPGELRERFLNQAIKEAASMGIFGKPSEPEKSVLVQVLTYESQIKMPPQGKLSPEAIASVRGETGAVEVHGSFERSGHVGGRCTQTITSTRVRGD